MLDKRNPYANNAAAAYVTAVNILAVEYLIKTDNEAEYGRLIDIVYKLDLGDLESLFILLDLNMHTSSLGAMITQGDYDTQKRILLEYLEGKEQ
jgi:hypothetical protein